MEMRWIKWQSAPVVVLIMSVAMPVAVLYKMLWANKAEQ